MASKVANYDGVDNTPQGFILNDAGMYSYVCQDVFPDILSFITAIPSHLKPLFLIPIRIEAPASHLASDGVVHIASKIANSHIADETVVDGNTPEGDLFGTKTFVYDDVTPNIPSSDPGSIYNIDSADERTHHQDLVDNQDQNIQPDTNTSFYGDVDLTDSNMGYPYRTPERPLRHSSEISIVVPINVRLALKPHELESKTPSGIKDNADSCSISLTSYDKRSRIFSFDVGCGNDSYVVRAKLDNLHHVALNCTCPFWRWNGPEYHASQNDYLLGNPVGKASPPNVRDPDRQFALCKHTYAVVARLDNFIEEISDENWGLDEEEVLEEVEENWDRMEGVAEIPLEEINKDDVEANVEEETEDSDDDSEEESETEEDSESVDIEEESEDSDDSDIEEESDEIDAEETEVEEDVDSEEDPDIKDIAEDIAEDSEEESSEDEDADEKK